MKKQEWRYRSVTERRYEIALRNAGQGLARSVKGLNTIQEITGQLISYTSSPKWIEFANQEALRMVRSTLVENAQTWREAAQKGQRAQEIHRLIKAEFGNNKQFYDLVRENAGYIKTLPSDIAHQITAQAAKRAMAGERSNDLVNVIKAKVPELAEWKAVRIARTEVAKAQSAVTQIRSLELGIKWYIWRTSEDQRVRSSHEIMEGVLCRFDTPPSPEALRGIKSTLGHYGPGGCPNCRCFAEPVIDVDFLTFPLKVYHGGKIIRMSKKQFLEAQ